MYKDTTYSGNLQQSPQNNLNPSVGVHHSFDIGLATKYGGYEAILIHHFLYWIHHNARNRKKNTFHEGRTWSYQTFEEIAEHFPYLTREQVRELMNRLTIGKNRKSKKSVPDFPPVLMKGNFNKAAYDSTVWYAFIDEKMWNIPSQEIIKEGSGEIPTPPGEIPTPIQYTIKDAKKDKIERGRSAPSSADASDVCDYFLSRLKERCTVTKPPDMQKWTKVFDLMLKDGYTKEKITEAIDWIAISTNGWFRKNILSPDSLRKQIDKILVDKQEEIPERCRAVNRRYAYEMKTQFPDQFKNIIIDKGGVTNPETGRDICFSIDPEAFKEIFSEIFGSR